MSFYLFNESKRGTLIIIIEVLYNSKTFYASSLDKDESIHTTSTPMIGLGKTSWVKVWLKSQHIIQTRNELRNSNDNFSRDYHRNLFNSKLKPNEDIDLSLDQCKVNLLSDPGCILICVMNFCKRLSVEKNQTLFRNILKIASNRKLYNSQVFKKAVDQIVAGPRLLLR